MYYLFLTTFWRTGIIHPYSLLFFIDLLMPSIREMALEDGRFLVSALRYDKLLMVSKLMYHMAQNFDRGKF